MNGWVKLPVKKCTFYLSLLLLSNLLAKHAGILVEVHMKQAKLLNCVPQLINYTYYLEEQLFSLFLSLSLRSAKSKLAFDVFTLSHPCNSRCLPDNCQVWTCLYEKAKSV